MRSKEQILEESAAQAAVQRNMSTFIIVLIVANVLIGILVAQLLYARFVRFPQTAFLGTTDAQSVCAPIGLDEPMVADAVARDYAVTAIRAIQTYDWTSWRDQINSSTSQYMTLTARNNYRISVNEWGIIRDVARRYQNATAQQRGPAIVTSQAVVQSEDGSPPRYEWQITVPMTLIYRNATDRRSENRNFYATVVRTAKSPLNPKGIAIGRLVSSQPVDIDSGPINPATTSSAEPQNAQPASAAGATQ